MLLLVCSRSREMPMKVPEWEDRFKTRKRKDCVNHMIREHQDCLQGSWSEMCHCRTETAHTDQCGINCQFLIPLLGVFLAMTCPVWKIRETCREPVCRVFFSTTLCKWLGTTKPCCWNLKSEMLSLSCQILNFSCLTVQSLLLVFYFTMCQMFSTDDRSGP